MRIVPIDHHSAATLTMEGSPSPADNADAPLTNTQNDVRGEVWRNPNTDALSFVGNFDDNLARPVNFFGAFHHRFQGANIRLQIYSLANAGGTELYDSGSVSSIWWTPDSTTYNWGGSLAYDPFVTEAPYIRWLPATYSARSYRISLLNFAGTSTYWPAHDAWQASRFVLGSYLEPITGPAFGMSYSVESVHDSLRSAGGSLRVSEGARWRVATIDLNAIRDSEARFWRDMARHVGYSRDFVVSPYGGDGTVEERDHTLLCKFVALDALNRQAKVLTRRLQLQEV